MSAPLRRAVLVAALVAVFASTGIVDRLVGRTTPPASPVGAFSAVGVAPGRGTESSAWYCAGGTGASGGAPGTIVLTNGTARPARGTVTVLPALAAGSTAPGPWAGASTLAVTVPADAQTVVGAAQLGAGGVVATAVVLDGGGVAVSQTVASPLGWSMAPCASTTAPDWYFAHAATSQGGGLILSLFNPGATDATVDVSLVSATAGVLVPAAYQGIDVPPGSLVTENLGDHAPDDSALATEVSTLSGSVVATELESVGKAGNGGLSLVLGSAVTARTWAFAQNTDVPGGTVAFHVLNPTSTPAVVSVAIELPRGAAAEPLTMTVAPQSTATLEAQSQTRIPAGVAYGVVLTSKGVPVVVGRQVSAPPGPAAPTPEDGDVPGQPGGWTRWVVPAVVAPGTGVASLAVEDLGPRPATVRILTAAGAAVAGQAGRVVRPGTPLTILPGTGSPLGTTPFQVRADQPVALEMDAEPVAGPGVVVVPTLAQG